MTEPDDQSRMSRTTAASERKQAGAASAADDTPVSRFIPAATRHALFSAPPRAIVW